jgi:flagellar FliL protein
MAEENKGSMSKILMIGLPIFIVQLVVVYFITANILLDKFKDEFKAEAVLGDLALLDSIKVPEEESESKEYGKFIHNIEDIIVNPANTSGEQLLLASMAFDLGSELNVTELESKDVMVKDLVISVLASKGIHELSRNEFKDTLRVEIKEKVEEFLPSVVINRIYFSKYIIN